MADIERLKYYDHQFLREREFELEQRYHIDMRRRLNRSLHGWGIAEGLRVEQAGNGGITIDPGVAIDVEGREIILESARTCNLQQFGPDSDLFVTIRYAERGERDDSGAEEFGRIFESPEIDIHKEAPHRDGSAIVLCRATVEGGGQVRIDGSVRKYIGSDIAPGSIHTRHLANGSVTPAKLSPHLRQLTGWVRLPFKPSPERDRPMFHVGPTEALTGREGGAGSMGIPAPPGAIRATGFRMAGEYNARGLHAELYRCGWNAEGQDHEKAIILAHDFHPGKMIAENRNPFEQYVPFHAELDPEHHALAVRVEAHGPSSISLISVHFEYEFFQYSRGLERDIAD